MSSTIMRRLSRRALHAARASEYVWPMALDVTSRIGWAEGDQAWRQLLGELLPLLEWDRKAARDVAHELVRHAERQREFTHPGYDV